MSADADIAAAAGRTRKNQKIPTARRLSGFLFLYLQTGPY